MEFKPREKRHAVVYGRVVSANKSWLQKKAEALGVSESELLDDILSQARQDDAGQKRKTHDRKAQ